MTGSYIEVAEELRANREQWKAYESQGNCVILAGPGSGKTKTITIKITGLLAEQVRPPRASLASPIATPVSVSSVPDCENSTSRMAIGYCYQRCTPFA